MSTNTRRDTFEVHGMTARRGACQWKRRCVVESLCLCCAFRLAPCVLLGPASSIPPSLLRLCMRFILSPHNLLSSKFATFSSQTSEFQHWSLSTVDSCFRFDSEFTMGCCASKQANELSQRTEEHRQQTPASTSDTFMNTVHPSCGTDNESVDLAGALALLRSNILDPFGAAHSDNRVDVKDLLKKSKTVLIFGSPSSIVAALCLLSTSQFTDDKLSGEVVEDMLKKSFGEHHGSDSRVSLTAVSTSSRFKAWCAAAGFDMSTVTNQDTAQQQRAEIFNEFEELSRLCASGGAQSAMCLLRSSWPQQQLAEAQRTGTPFIVPSRGALPDVAAHSAPMTKDTVFIVVLSYCWAGPGQPDPRNKLLCDVCRFLAYLHCSRHFGDANPEVKEMNLGDREVLLFWDYPCLYQKSDTSTGGVTFLKLDSFERGLASINVLYGHVGTLSLLCTQSYPIVNAKGTRSRPGPTSRCSSPRSSRMRTWPSTCPRRSSGSGALVATLLSMKVAGASTGSTSASGVRSGSCPWCLTRSMVRSRTSTPRTEVTLTS